MMVRLLAFARHAHQALAFAAARTDDEPDLWRKDLTGAIDLWIDVGQPTRSGSGGRAVARAVFVYAGGRAPISGGAGRRVARSRREPHRHQPP
jgi:uncharacterized protein YaeQ